MVKARNRKHYIRAFVTVTVLVALVFPGAGGAQNDTSPDLEFFGPGTRGISGPDVVQLAKDSDAALQAIPAQRDGRVIPDANYIATVQKTFIKLRKNIANTALDNLVETTDQRLLSDSDFRSNLRALFEKQAKDSTAAAAISDNRVLGGSDIVSAKDVVAIVDNLDGAPGELCSGILIDQRHVLTAGHCVCLHADVGVKITHTIDDTSPLAAYFVDPVSPADPATKESAELFPGSHCPSLPTGIDESTRDYRIGEALKGHDLAVLKLTRSVPASIGKPDTILGPVQFAAWQAAKTGFIRVGGFGFQAVLVPGVPDPTAYGTLRFADLAIAAPMCRESDRQPFDCVPGQEIVAATNPNMSVRSTINVSGSVHDTCQGDSGGPAYAQVLIAGVPKFYPIAVTSRAATESGCGAGSIYTLLNAPGVRQWIAVVASGASFTN